MRNKKSKKYLWLLLLLLAVSIGYAAISTTLKITGSATVTKQTWNVYWDTPVVTTGSKSMTAPTRTQDSGDSANTKLEWTVTLDLPGDFYEFTVDAVNAGTIDAMIAVNGITNTVSPALPVNPDYIKYEVTYEDGTTVPLEKHLLPKATVSGNTTTPTKEKYKVRVYYDENAATRDTINNMSATTTYTFTFGVTYIQATDDAVIPNPKCPGPGCVYAFYDTAYDTYPYYHFGPGDVMPLEFATSGPGATSNYFGGPTTNYNSLKIEYNRYKRVSEYEIDYWNSEDECDEHVSYYGGSCTFDKLISFTPKVFMGHTLDNNRIKAQYVCLAYSNGVYCIKVRDENGYTTPYANSTVFDELTEIYGEYDSVTETGCNIDNSSNSIHCISSDESIEVFVDNNEATFSQRDLTENYIITNGTGAIIGPHPMD